MCDFTRLQTQANLINSEQELKVQYSCHNHTLWFHKNCGAATWPQLHFLSSPQKEKESHKLLEPDLSERGDCWFWHMPGGIFHASTYLSNLNQLSEYPDCFFEKRRTSFLLLAHWLNPNSPNFLHTPSNQMKLVGCPITKWSLNRQIDFGSDQWSLIIDQCRNPTDDSRII